MHNLKTVYIFEVIRTVKKKSFWILALSFPLMMAVIFGIIIFANKTTREAADNTQNQAFTIGITDTSNLVNPTIITQLKAKTISDKATGIAEVQKGTLDAYFYYPTSIEREKVEVYGKDVGIFDNGRYGAVAKMLLDNSAQSSVDSNLRAILSNKVQYGTTMYKDGEISDPLKKMIAPGVFLILFYALIAMFGGQMLTSTTEEKENRVIEMILTTIESRTLIIGKILSLVTLGFIQMLIILVPIVVAYLLFRDSLSIPTIDFSSLPVDWLRMLIGASIFASSFALFTGLLVAIGAAAPTAKEAGGFFGVVMMIIFGPLYAAPLFISMPGSLLVQMLSYFPFTAPIPLLLRNAVGNLSLSEAAIAVTILVVTAALVIRIAVRTFRYGALEYNRKLGFKEIFLGR